MLSSYLILANQKERVEGTSATCHGRIMLTWELTGFEPVTPLLRRNVER